MDAVEWLAFGAAVFLMCLPAVGVIVYLTRDLWKHMGGAWTEDGEGEI